MQNIQIKKFIRGMESKIVPPPCGPRSALYLPALRGEDAAAIPGGLDNKTLQFPWQKIFDNTPDFFMLPTDMGKSIEISSIPKYYDTEYAAEISNCESITRKALEFLLGPDIRMPVTSTIFRFINPGVYQIGTLGSLWGY